VADGSNLTVHVRVSIHVCPLYARTPLPGKTANPPSWEGQTHVSDMQRRGPLTGSMGEAHDRTTTHRWATGSVRLGVPPPVARVVVPLSFCAFHRPAGREIGVAALDPKSQANEWVSCSDPLTCLTAR